MIEIYKSVNPVVFAVVFLCSLGCWFFCRLRIFVHGNQWQHNICQKTQNKDVWYTVNMAKCLYLSGIKNGNQKEPESIGRIRKSKILTIPNPCVYQEKLQKPAMPDFSCSAWVVSLLPPLIYKKRILFKTTLETQQTLSLQMCPLQACGAMKQMGEINNQAGALVFFLMLFTHDAVQRWSHRGKRTVSTHQWIIPQSASFRMTK